MMMSAEWLHRFNLGQCDGHIITEPLCDVDTSTRPLPAVRETSTLTVDLRLWQFRDVAVSLRRQKA